MWGRNGAQPDSAKTGEMGRRFLWRLSTCTDPTSREQIGVQMALLRKFGSPFAATGSVPRAVTFTNLGIGVRSNT